MNVRSSFRQLLLRWIVSLAPPLVLIGLWALFFWRIFTPDPSARLTFQHGDFTLQFLAYRQVAFRHLREGRFPLFEPCLYSGYPFQADPQSQMLYPPVLLTMLAGRALGWEAYPLEALEWEAMSHVLWAALGTYVFLRRGLRLRRIAALFGALAFGFGGFLTGYPILQTGILETAAWLPWLLLALRKLIESQVWLVWAVASAAVVAVAFTAGHPQTLMLSLYAAGLLFLAWSFRRLSLQRCLARIGAVVVLAVGLSAAQAWPTVSYMLASSRASIPYEHSAHGFPLHDLSLVLLAGVTNFFQPLYVGVVALLMAMLALALRAHTAWIWAGLALVALALSFGGNAFAFDVAYWLAPGYRLFRSQERHAFLFSFALSVLGAMGLNRLLAPLWAEARDRVRAWGERLIGWSAGAFALFLVVLLAISGKLIDAKALPQATDRLALLAIGLAGTAALVRWRADLGGAGRAVWGGAAIALLVFDVFTANRYTVTQPFAEPFPPSPLLKPIVEAESASRRRGLTPRIYNHYGLPLNYACVFGQQEVGGGSPIVPAHYKAYLERAPEGVMVRQLNARYAVTWRGAMVTPEGETIPWFLLARTQTPQGEASTYRLDWEPLDFDGAWIADDVRLLPHADAIFEALRAPGYDVFRTAFVFAQDRARIQRAVGTDALRGRGEAAVEGHAATGYVKVAVNVDAPALLVLSMAYHWNWVALIDGNVVPTVPVNVGLLGVPIPAGARSIELSYHPFDFYAGLAVSGASVVACVLLLALAPRLHARRSPQQDSSSLGGGLGGASATT
ncbi:MAG: YfhO family protein [Anaerolineae bacterium]|nr:YfhO family protein [Anaerolineae bacterium]